MEYPTCAPKFQWPRLAEYAGASAVVGITACASGEGVCANWGVRARKVHPASSAHAANFANGLCQLNHIP